MQQVDEDFVRKNFGRIWPMHVATLTEFLLTCRRYFDGDLDLMLVLCVIGDRTFTAKRVPKDLTYEQWSAGGGRSIVLEPINLQSVADFSGIPKETVRRKVKELIERGWVERNDAGYLAATRQAAVELTGLTEEGLKYLSQMASVLTVPSEE